MSFSTLRVVPAVQFKLGPEVYSMTKNPRGTCIIINNTPLDLHAPGMVGSELDVQRIEALFRQLHFQVTIKSNVSADETRQLLRDASKAESQADAECLVVVLIFPGKENTIYGSDGEVVHLEHDVYQCFNNENCPALIGKPKIFFVQSCGVADDHNESEDQGANAEKTPAATGDSSHDNSSMPHQRTPVVSDMYIAHVTIPANAALRNHHVGSWFLSAVSEVFSEHAGNMSLDGLMKRVHDRVMQCSAEDAIRQTPSVYKFGWCKKLYFNPGLYV